MILSFNYLYFLVTDYILTDVEGQQILGFGGAITDAAAYNILSMSNETQQNLLR